MSIDALVAQIVADNPELQFYREALVAARGERRGLRSLPDPELSLELGRKRVREPASSLAAEGTAWSVSVTQTFEWPGRHRLRKAMANGEVQLAELGLARFEAALAARARTLALNLHAANVQAAAVREVADRFAALKETFLARDPAGITPELETRVIEAQDLALQRRATEAELALEHALLELNQLRGVPAGTPLRVAVRPVTFHDLPDPATLLAAARENHFGYRARQLELEQQGFAVQLAHRERYPEVSVSPFYSSERAGERETMAGVGVSLPLPVTGRAQAAVTPALARQRPAEAMLRVAERELEREVLTAAQTYAHKLHEIRRWSAQPIDRFREAAALADRHYRLGAVPIGTYVELQSAYLEAVEALLLTETEAVRAALELERLTGLKTPLVTPLAP